MDIYIILVGFVCENHVFNKLLLSVCCYITCQSEHYTKQIALTLSATQTLTKLMALGRQNFTAGVMVEYDLIKWSVSFFTVVHVIIWDLFI